MCKSTAEIEKMRRSGGIVRDVLNHVRGLVVPGATTMDLERAAEQKIKGLGVKPAFKGYYDYPCVLCTSINEEIVHGIPSEKRVMKAGDIVEVKLIEVQPDGKFRLSRKALIPRPEGMPEEEERPRRDRPQGDRRGGPSGGGDRRGPRRF